ncbi:MAG TPA: hypothetical protein VIX38_06920 [Nitrososphaeraceae archaeon]
MGDESKADVNIELMEREIVPGQELHGKVSVNYAGRFDSIVINSQIENSSDIFNFTSINGKKVNHQYARLSIFKDDLKDKNYLEFTAVTSHKPRNRHTNAKFRVAVIQEHKEVVSALAYVKILG